MSESADPHPVEAKLCGFISEVLLSGKAMKLGRSTALVELGLLDSMAVLTLLSFVEQEFGVAIPLEEVVLQDFRDVAAIAQMIERRR